VKPVVFVDMDETLLHYDIAEDVTEVRPGAYDALHLLRQFADVYVFSAGGPDYIRDRLTETRMRNMVNGAFSVQNYPGPEWIGRRKWVLLDNDPFLADVKCSLIDPEGPCRWIEVEDFLGQSRVVPLTAYLQTVKQALA
jgi:hypothetical protein